MHFSKKFRALPWYILLATSVFLGGFSVALKPRQQTRGDIVSGLQLTIHLDQEKVGSRDPKFRVELRDAAADAIVLTLRDTHGKSRPLQLREPFPIAGRVDPFVLPLPAGATFSIPVDFDKYLVMPRPEESDFRLQAGTYTLEAQFTGKGVSFNKKPTMA
jgi:hypothetical protein